MIRGGVSPNDLLCGFSIECTVHGWVSFVAASGVVFLSRARGGLQLDCVGGALGARANNFHGLVSVMITSKDVRCEDRDEDE